MIAQIDWVMLKKRIWKIPGRIIAWALIEGRPLTTKGRWINGLVFAGYRFAQCLPAPRKVRSPIYIVGTGRSGTTILGKLFAIHRETVFLNEPKALWHFTKGEEDIIGSYAVFPGRLRLDAKDADSNMARIISHIYSWALFWGAARRVVDKYPEMIFRVGFVKALFPDARFLAILRDGVDTCSSVTAWSRHKGVIEGSDVHDWWGRDGRKWRTLVEQEVPSHPDLAPIAAQLTSVNDHRDRAAVEWIVSMRAATRSSVEYPDSVLMLRYEDLCANPDEVTARMLDYCGLSSDSVFLSYSKEVLSAAEAYKPLELMPDLVTPFCETLREMGYESSIKRVSARSEQDVAG